MFESFSIKNIKTLTNSDDIKNHIQEIFFYLEKISDIEYENFLELKLVQFIHEVQEQITPAIIDKHITDKQIEKIFDLNFLNFNKHAYFLKMYFLSNLSDEKIEKYNKNNLKKFNSFLLLFFSNDEDNPLFLKLSSLQKKEIFEKIKKTNENKKFKI